MIIKKLTLKPDTPDHEYTRLCNTAEKQGVFRACGNTDDKWIMLTFEDEIDFLAWSVAMGFAEMQECQK